MKGGAGWPWVNASGVKGIRSIRIEPVAKRATPLGNNFSVRWMGMIRPEFGEEYTFHARTDYGVRLWVGDRLVIDNSKKLAQGEVSEPSGKVTLDAGKKYPIRMEYYHKDRPQHAVAELRWSSARVRSRSSRQPRFLRPMGRAVA